LALSLSALISALRMISLAKLGLRPAGQAHPTGPRFAVCAAVLRTSALLTVEQRRTLEPR